MGARVHPARAAFAQSCLPINYVSSLMHSLTTGTWILELVRTDGTALGDLLPQLVRLGLKTPSCRKV